MSTYAAWVGAHPWGSAALQFALLGTLGEVVASSARLRRLALPCTPAQLAAKVAAWAVLGLLIKFGFAGMRGFVQALLDHGALPAWVADGVGRALALSVLTNVFFGPQMMAFHRWEDNLILGRRDWAGLTTAWKTLIWFWIPAHTLTFSLPHDYQIGLAALWGLVLGILLGWSSGAKTTQPPAP